MNRLFVLILFFLATKVLVGQVSNYGLHFLGSGSLTTANVVGFGTSEAVTFQGWFNTSQWLEHSSLFELGVGDHSSLRLVLGEQATGTLKIELATEEGVISGTAQNALAENKWQQITLVYSKIIPAEILLYVDGKELPLAFSSSVPSIDLGTFDRITIGSNFIGRMDEVRVWNTALPFSDHSLSATINHYHPFWSNLVAYYKFDQPQLSACYDLNGVNHAKGVNVNKVVVEDNPGFVYRTVTGYTDYNRFIDRQINDEMYLMTNDLIVLAPKVLSDGSIYMPYPDLSGKLSGVNHLSNFGGRAGVLNFTGAGSHMSVGTEAFQGDLGANLSKFTFSGWFYIDEWVEGSCLIKKYQDEANQVVVALGSVADQALVVKLNKATFTIKSKVKTGVWQYISVIYDGTASRENYVMNFNFDLSATNIQATVVDKGGETALPKSIPLMVETRADFGENFKGKMDEVMLWSTNRSASSIISDATKGILIPSGLNDNIWLRGYWKCDDASIPGYDSYSWINFNKIMRSKYDGFHGALFRVGVLGGDSWQSVIGDAAKCSKLVSSIASLYPYFDGVDVDFEWCYNDNACWDNLGRMILDLKAVTPVGKKLSVSPHVVSYAFPLDAMAKVDYFTFQNYGPSPDRFLYADFVNSYSSFSNYGFPDQKIRLSVPTLATNSAKAVTGYVNIVKSNPDLDPALNNVTYNGTLYTFTGVDETKKRCQFIVDKKLGGVMYFDMGNDVVTTSDKSLIRAINVVIPSNVQKYISPDDISTGVDTPIKQSIQYLLAPNPAKDCFRLVVGEPGVRYEIGLFSTDGRIVKKFSNVRLNESLDVSELPVGIYLVNVVSGNSVGAAKLRVL
ncbi:MAG: T9SS type A sorting domain-containing protein [Breznakibacter sp.]|nr:T9SS type A sorting domain-containing protein [Breznakibacter sp.]